MSTPEERFEVIQAEYEWRRRELQKLVSDQARWDRIESLLVGVGIGAGIATLLNHLFGL